MSTPEVLREARSEILDLLRRRQRFVTVTHEHPDGDAIGSLVAATRALTALGKDVVAVLGPGDLPLAREYAGLVTIDLALTAPTDLADRTALFLDCGNLDRMAVDAVRSGARETVNIDHHHDNTRFGAFNLVDSTASSTVEILWELFVALKAPIDRDTAKALYVGLITDTGRFMYENTSERSHRMAADLIATGVEPFPIYRALYEGVPWAKLALLGRALSRVRIERDGQLIFALVRRTDYEETAAADTDSEGIIDHLRTLSGMRLAALAREIPSDDGVRTKVSLRSSGSGIDVSAIARAAGGGGHPQAAGFTTDLGEEELVAFLSAQLQALR